MKKLPVFAVVAAMVCLLVACHKKPEPTRRSATEPAAKAKPVSPPPQRPSAPVEAVPVMVSPGSLRYLDFRNGFRDVVFGQPPSAISNLVFKTQDPSKLMKTYTRQGEVLELAGVPLTSIEYIFFNDQLYQIELQWRVTLDDPSRTPSITLAEFCNNLYGPHRRRVTAKTGAEYIWRGKRVYLGLRETVMPGVPDMTTKVSWALPPAANGFMLIENLDLRKSVQLALAANAGRRQNGL